MLSAGTASLYVDDSYVPTSVCMSGGPSIERGPQQIIERLYTHTHTRAHAHTHTHTHTRTHAHAHTHTHMHTRTHTHTACVTLYSIVRHKKHSQQSSNYALTNTGYSVYTVPQ